MCPEGESMMRGREGGKSGGGEREGRGEGRGGGGGVRKREKTALAVKPGFQAFWTKEHESTHLGFNAVLCQAQCYEKGREEA